MTTPSTSPGGAAAERKPAHEPSPMTRHFAKLSCVTVQLDFPEKWGDPFRRVRYDDDTINFNDAIWEAWSGLIEDDERGIEDESNGFDVAGVRFTVIGFDSEAELAGHIDWCEEQLAAAYREVMSQQPKRARRAALTPEAP